MTKDVIISISGNQDDGAPGGERVTLVTDGRYYKRKDKHYITYDESEITGLLDTKTTIRVDENSATVTRTGLYKSQLIFEKNKRHYSFYQTEYGGVTVSISTSGIDFRVLKDSLHLDVAYSVEVEHMHTGDNNLIVDVRSAGARPTRRADAGGSN